MPDIVSTLLAFIVALGLLIVVHEFGHFIVARWCGVRVIRFSIGFGKSIWRKRLGKDRTELSIGLLPLGGYVKMLDEREAPVRPEELHRAFNRQSIAKRNAIVVAGPLANFLLAILVYWVLFVSGTQELLPILGTPPANTPAAVAEIVDGERVRAVDDEVVASWEDFRWALLRRAADADEVRLTLINAKEEIAFRTIAVAAIREDGWEGDAFARLGLQLHRPQIPAVLGTVTPASPAERAGLLAGDRIIAIDGVEIQSWHDVVEKIRSSQGRPIHLELRRHDETVELSLQAEAFEAGGKSSWRIGVGVADPGDSVRVMRGTVRYGPLDAAGRALRETWDKSVFSLVMFGKMLLGEVSWKTLAGPVTIADFAGQSARMGADYYLKFIALVSISLGVLNLLPVPVLDGGHLMYHTLEFIKRGPLSERFVAITQQLGMFLLLALMSFAIFNDIHRLVSG